MSLESLIPFRDPVRLLKKVGLWITEDSSKGYLVYSFIIHLIFIDIFTLLQIIYLFEFKTFEDFARLMTLMPTYCGLFLKSVNIILNLRSVIKLLDTTNELLLQCPDTTKVTKRIIVADKVFRTTSIVSFITTILGALTTVFELPYIMWFPWDIDSHLGYWLAALYQASDTICFSIVVMALDMLPVFFMAYSLGFFEVLCDRLESLKKKRVSRNTSKNRDDEIIDRDNIDNYEEFIDCIEFQLKLDDYIKQIEATFSKVLFIQGLMSVLILCTGIVAITVVSLDVLF